MQAVNKDVAVFNETINYEGDTRMNFKDGVESRNLENIEISKAIPTIPKIVSDIVNFE